MKPKNLRNSSRFTARLRTLLVMFVTLSMFNMSADVLTLDDFTPANLDSEAHTMSVSLFVISGQTTIEIPDTFVIDDVSYGVTGISASAFNNDLTLTSVTLPSTLVSIGDRAFQSSGLLSVTIPASVETIGQFAFAENRSMTSVTFEDESQLTTINKSAFRNCCNVTLPSVRTDYIVSWFENGVTMNDLTVLKATWATTNVYTAEWVSSLAAASVITFNANSGTGTMADLNSIVGATLTLPANTLTKAGYYFKGWAIASDGEVLYTDEASFTSAAENEELFAVWGELGDLILDNGEGVTETIEIGVERTLVLPATSFTKEGHYLYGWATTAEGDAYYSFESFYTPSALTQTLYAIWEPIPAGYMTTGMEMLKISEFTPVLVDQTLSVTAYTELGQDSACFYIPPTYVVDGVVYTVTKLGAQAFMSKALTRIVLPNTLITIGNRALHNNNLDTIMIPASVTTFEDFAMSYNAALKNVIFEEGSQLETIGANAFYNHAALDSITIPASVKSIGANAFSSDRSPVLQKVTFEEFSQLESVGSEAFINCTALPSFTLPRVQINYRAEWTSSVDGVLDVNELEITSAGYAASYTAVWTQGIPVFVDGISNSNSSIEVYPNPVSDVLRFKADYSQNIVFNIYNNVGQLVYSGLTKSGNNSIDVGVLPTGVYVLTLAYNKNILTSQFIKK